MRRLGQELGVEAMSVYTHVAGREELLDGLSEVMVEALPRSAAASDWRDAVSAFANGIRTTARRHPQAFLLVGMRPLKTVQALTPVDAMLAALRGGGFGTGEAVAAYRLVASYARGFALAEIQGFTLDEAFVTPLPTTHATVAVVRATPGALDHDMAFVAGLETILTGLAARR
jgi:AcrR family transcriptional regulator